jgi:polysaccharide biosynthesis protein PslH
MKILMLVPFLPNTSMSGGQTRWYNIIKYLSTRHEITLFSLIKDESELRFIPELEKYCKIVKVFNRSKSPWTFRNLFLAIFTFYPLLVVRNWSPKLRRAIAQELADKKYDLIHAETFYVMPHLPRSSIPAILVEQTIEYQVYKHFVDTKVPFVLRPLFMIEIIKLRFWELYFWKKADRLVAVSDDDREVMQELIPRIKVDVIPNGVDAKHFAVKTVEKKQPPRVMYGVTNFEWLQNVEAVDTLIDDVWPQIQKSVPEAKLWIVGRKFPDRLIKLSQEREDIEITESIEDARDAYLGASIMVAPIRGSGGTRLKILEAMASGLPIVSTTIGVAGLGLTNGQHALIADDSKELAMQAVKLLRNPKLAKKIGNEGKLFVQNHYDWKMIVQIHDRIYDEIT